MQEKTPTSNGRGRRLRPERAFACALAVASSLVVAAAPAGEGATALIIYPGVGQYGTEVWNVNDRAQAVGTSFDSNFNFLASFVYDIRSEEFTTLAPIAGFGEFDALGINDTGIIVGGAYTPDYSSESAFILDRSGRYTLFTHPGSQVPNCGTQARAINVTGLIVGEACTPDGADLLGFIYDPASRKFTDIHPSVNTFAGGINAWGWVTGSADFPANGLYPGSPAGSYSWLRTDDGKITLFSVNGYQTEARGINDLGEITGLVFIDACSCEKGFVITLEQLIGDKAEVGGFVAVTVPDSALFVPTGKAQAAGEGINNLGVVVGNTSDNVISFGFVRLPSF